jgi:hypothetical protein
MMRVAVLPTAVVEDVPVPQGIDLDHDSRREFVMITLEDDLTKVYEAIADNTFVLAHTVPVLRDTGFKARDAGDSDGDGLAELVGLFYDIGGPEPLEYSLRIYREPIVDNLPCCGGLAGDQRPTHGSSDRRDDPGRRR